MISAQHVAEAELPRQLRPQASETRAPLPSMRIGRNALAITAKLGAEIAFAGLPPPAGWHTLENVR